jgi:glycosyltransferase involved in cell wall biosynthesis
MVVTRRDPLAEVVEQHDLGRVVPPGDVDALAAALLDLLGRDNPRAEMATRFAEVAQTFTWDRVAAPLAEFMRQPRFAPDARRALERLEPAARAKELEETLQTIQQGRVMRFLRWVDRLRGLA